MPLVIIPLLRGYAVNQFERKPYSERSDIEKIESNWKKLAGLLSRNEWSAVIVRAATAAEIAANLAVRHELQEQRKLEKKFVDSLLKWANGLPGKLEKLLERLDTTKERSDLFRDLKKNCQQINKERNAVVHSGHFMNEEEARKIVALSRELINQLVNQYHPGFTLPDPCASTPPERRS